MERYFRQRKIRYTSVQFFAKMIGITQKCPYIVGDEAFVPDKGHSKNHANWIAMHHVREAESLGNQSILSIQRHHELILDLTIKRLYKMAENVKKISISQKKMTYDYLNQWNVRASHKKDENILDRIEVQLPEALPNVLSFQNQLVCFRALHMLSTVCEEGDPYLDEMKELFSNFKDSDI